MVTITGDKHITKKRAVSIREDYRARQIASLEMVDYVAIVDEPSAVAAIEALQPDVYVKGPEYSNLLLDKTSNISHEKALVESYGGRIHFTEMFLLGEGGSGRYFGMGVAVGDYDNDGWPDMF